MNNSRNLIVLVVVLILGFLAYGFLTMPDNRTTSERVGDAIHDLPKGVDKAGDQLHDRTPAQKLGDKIDDTANGH